MESVDPSKSSMAKSTIRKVIKAKVIFDYDAKEEDELSLKVGNIITEVESESEDEEWYSGILNRRRGIFPKSYVEVFEELKKTPQRPPRRKAKQKDDYQASETLSQKRSVKTAEESPGTSSSNQSQSQQTTIITQMYVAGGHYSTNDKDSNKTMMVNQPLQNNAADQEAAKEKLLQKLLIYINQDTYARTHVKVTEGFETGNITEPDSVFHPQISEVPDFYKGIHVEEDQFDADAVSSDDRSSCDGNPTVDFGPMHKIEGSSQSQVSKQSQNIQWQERKKRMKDKKKLQIESKQKRFEYIKDRLFEFKAKASQKTLTFRSLKGIISSPTSDDGVLAIVSQAGSGKTTIMKQAGRAIMKLSGITPERKFQPTSNSRFKLVVYRDFKSIESHNVMTLQKLIFKSYCNNEEEEKLLYSWVIENQSKVALFFDGYDQAPWNISKEHCDNYSGPRQEADTQTVISNLLAQKTLPEARIIISSREFKAAALPDYTRPKKVFTLTGFNEEDAGKLFNKLVSSPTTCGEQPKSNGHKSEKLSVMTKKSNPWNQICTSSPLLTSFLSIPVFLVLSAILFTSNIASLPSTMTGLLSLVLHLLHSSRHSRYQGNTKNLIEKLKRLAHDGMVDGYVLFTPKHLQKHDLKVEEVSDLLLGIPKNKYLNQCLFESDFFIFFCHQSIQEFLSACFISEMNIEQFQIFVKEHLHLPRWSIVRRFVFGLVYNIKGGNFVSIISHEEKKAILLGSLTSEVVNVRGYELLEFFQTLFESNDDELIKSHVQEIQLSYTPLGINEVKLLSYVLSRCSKIKSLDFMDCGLNDELLGIIKIADIHVGSINLQYNQISFAALNCFLDNLQVGKLLLQNYYISGKGGLNWKNVLKVTVEILTFYSLVFTNEIDSIKVEAGGFNGIFNKDNKTLEIEIKDRESDIMVLLYITAAEKLLQPTSLNFNNNNITFLKQQYLEYEALEKMLKWNVNFMISKVLPNCRDAPKISPSVIRSFKEKYQIPEVVLNCRDAQKISPSVIRSFKEKYQIDVLDIAVRIHQSSIAEGFYDESTSIKIHVWERVEYRTGIKDLATNLKENKAGNLTVVPYDYAPSTEDIVMLINSCQSKALTLVYHKWFVDGMKDLDQSRLMEAAESSSVKLNLQLHTGLDGAWLNLYEKVWRWG